MNCKQGDLAMVVGGNHPHLYGRLITVYHVVGCNQFGALWSYGEKLLVGERIIEHVEDCCLKPVRDHGDDAVDEMVQLVGSATARTS